MTGPGIDEEEMEFGWRCMECGCTSMTSKLISVDNYASRHICQKCKDEKEKREKREKK